MDVRSLMGSDQEHLRSMSLLTLQRFSTKDTTEDDGLGLRAVWLVRSASMSAVNSNTLIP